MLTTLIVNILLQLLHSVGAFVAIGFLVASLNRVFYNLCGNSAVRVNRLTGIIGTPVHELGHAFFCLIFRHKILEIKLYEPRGNTLGYVRHSFDPRSFYQRVGRFFVGVGPIPFGALVLALLLWLLLPVTFQDFHHRLNLFAAAANDGTLHFRRMAEAIFGLFTDFFAPANLLNFRWWLYLVPACFIALHVNLSKADIDGAGPGAICFALLVAGVNLVLAIFGTGMLNKYHNAFLQVCMFVLGIMFLCVFFCLLGIALAFLVSLAAKQFGRRK